MRVHILGICGTFMGSLAVLAKQLGHEVSGSDQSVYPPMSTQLEEQGIRLCNGYDPQHIDDNQPDIVVIGNTCSRGNAAVEYVLDQGLPFTSGPAWLAEHVLQSRWVIGVAGTHGKTTTTSMVSWILEFAGMQPGYLIGGVPANFSVSARLGESDFFVIEADEYDSAFFDKRSKFIHYLPRTVIMANLEFDHADIFRNLEDIQIQFHHLCKTIPQHGLIVAPKDDEPLAEVFARGVWSDLQYFNGSDAEWQFKAVKADGSEFELSRSTEKGRESARVSWGMLGKHNMSNALAAVAAAAHVGVPLSVSCEALSAFKGVKRRLELLGTISGVRVYDDFAHHPTAISTTLAGLRESISLSECPGRLIVLIEARSNTMKAGYHQQALATSLQQADEVLWFRSSDNQLDLDAIAGEVKGGFQALDTTEEMIGWVVRHAEQGDHVVIMSNGGFEGIHKRLVQQMTSRAGEMHD